MNIPFDTDGLTPHEIVEVYEGYNAIKAKFAIEATGHIDFELNNFEVFKNCTELIVRNSYAIKDADGCYVLLVETYNKIVFADGTVSELREYHWWALAYLKQDFGKVRIRPETLRDKIVELITPIEIDFKEDKAFSNAFYVLANNHNKAVAGLNSNFRKAVMDVRDDEIVIEILNHALLIGNHKPASSEAAVHLAEFVTKVAANK